MRIDGVPFLAWLKEEQSRTGSHEIKALLVKVIAMANRHEVSDSYQVGLRAYNAKLDDFYNTTGRPAIEMAMKLHEGGASYATIADELSLAGYLTVNGHSKWSTAQIRRYVMRVKNSKLREQHDEAPI